MCNDLSAFTDSPLSPISASVKFGDKTTVKVTQAGMISFLGLQFFAFYVPSFRFCLASVPQMDAKGLSCVFAANEVCIRNGERVLAVGFKNTSSNLYIVAENGSTPISQNVSSALINTPLSEDTVLITTRAGAARERTEAEERYKKGVQVATFQLMVNRAAKTRRESMVISDSEDSGSDLQHYNVTPPTITNAVKTALSISNTSSSIRPLGYSSANKANGLIWHGRFGHINDVAMTKVLRNEMDKVAGSLSDYSCDVCVRTAATQRTGKDISIPRSLIPFERIHADICGPFSPTLGGSRYYAVFVEDSCRLGEVFTMKRKSDLILMWNHYKKRKLNLGFVILYLRSDNGGEFQALDEELRNDGIVWERSPPYTQHSNGVAERFIRSINTKARALLIAAESPEWCWGDAVTMSCYLHGMTPQRGLNWKSPLNMFYSYGGGDIQHNLHEKDKYRFFPTTVKHLRLFGCVAYRWLHPKQRKSGKFVVRASPCMFLGYGLSKSIYRLYDFVSKRFYEASSVTFREDQKAWPLFGDKSAHDIQKLFNGYCEVDSAEDSIELADNTSVLQCDVLNSQRGNLSIQSIPKILSIIASFYESYPIRGIDHI